MACLESGEDREGQTGKGVGDVVLGVKHGAESLYLLFHWVIELLPNRYSYYPHLMGINISSWIKLPKVTEMVGSKPWISVQMRSSRLWPRPRVCLSHDGAWSMGPRISHLRVVVPLCIHRLSYSLNNGQALSKNTHLQILSALEVTHFYPPKYIGNQVI